MKRALFYFFLFFASFSTSYTQELSTKAISVSPVYLFFNGIRIDYELKVNQQHWVNFYPLLYIYDSGVDSTQPNSGYYSYSTNDYDKLIGVGGGLGFRNNLITTEAGNIWYFAYGLEYVNYKITYYETDWAKYVIMGLPTYQLGIINKQTLINQYSASMTMGLKIRIVPRVYMDLFGGFKIKYSEHEFINGSERNYSGSIFQFGYSGIMPYCGAKMTVCF